MSYWLQGIGGGWQALEKFSMMLVSLEREVSTRKRKVRLIVHGRTAHERKSTVCTPVDLWLVDIDEDPWVTQRPSTSIARDNPCVRPSHRLFVDQIDCSFRLGLH